MPVHSFDSPGVGWHFRFWWISRPIITTAGGCLGPHSAAPVTSIHARSTAIRAIYSVAALLVEMFPAPAAVALACYVHRLVRPVHVFVAQSTHRLVAIGVQGIHTPRRLLAIDALADPRFLVRVFVVVCPVSRAPIAVDTLVVAGVPFLDPNSGVG